MTPGAPEPVTVDSGHQNDFRISKEAVSAATSVHPQRVVDDDILRRVREIMVEASTRGIDPVNMEALQRVLMTGSTEQVARAMGISPRAVRYRCARVAAELAEFTRVA